jgi:aryl-alcohol dehydrogenase-like predicted oxidoreductase
MEYRQLGSTGLKVSSICLGTMMYGSQVDEKTAVATVNRAVDGGINFIDTANVYAHTEDLADRGKSEQYVGKALKGKRHSVVIATKVGGDMGPGIYDIGLSRKLIMKEVEDSLRRLQTDFIDLYYAHVPDEYTPIEETLRAFDDLVRQGKVRYIGGCNLHCYALGKALWTSEKQGLVRYQVLQSPYNLLTRDLEYEVRPLCKQEGLGICAYNPLAAGLLTGKYDFNKPPAEGTRYAMEFVGAIHAGLYWTEDNFIAIDKLKKLAQARGCSLAQFSLAWIVNNITCVITGTSKVKQLEENIEAAEIKLTDEELDACDDVWHELHSSGYRINTIREHRMYKPRRRKYADWDF